MSLEAEQKPKRKPVRFRAYKRRMREAAKCQANHEADVQAYEQAAWKLIKKP